MTLPPVARSCLALTTRGAPRCASSNINQRSDWGLVLARRGTVLDAMAWDELAASRRLEVSRPHRVMLWLSCASGHGLCA